MPRQAIYILSAILLLEAAIIFEQRRVLAELRTIRDTTAVVETIKRETKKVLPDFVWVCGLKAVNGERWETFGITA